MKKIFMLIIILCSLFIFTSCKSNEEISNKSIALNKVNLSKTADSIDNNYVNNLVNTSFKLFNLMSEEEKDNYCASPLSIYMALALLDLIGDNNVKKEISELVELTEEEILLSGRLYEWLNKEYRVGEDLVKPVLITNSIWVDNHYTQDADQKALDELADKLYCYAYETPFFDNNKLANEDIRKFIKEMTKGLIDNDFDLSPKTVFALINTLYFKDVWNYDGPLYGKDAIFKLSNGEIVTTKFLNNGYLPGIAYENEVGSMFYTHTACGYRIYFLLPNEGHEIKEVMNYNYYNQGYNFIKSGYSGHETCCIFPKFKVDSDTDVKKILEKNNYFNQTFNSYQSTLFSQQMSVDRIIHKTVIKVDENGIEGAAVTIISGKGDGAYDELKRHDFIVDRPFGFVITTKDNIILFMGQITNPIK